MMSEEINLQIILSDSVIQNSLDELWPGMESVYNNAYPNTFTEETFTNGLNDFARHFSPDFINSLFMSSLGIIGRRISGELDDDQVYFDLTNEDFPRGKEFVTNHGPQNMHYACIAPWVFKSLSIYRDLHNVLRIKYKEETGEEAPQKELSKRVYRGLLFSLEKCYNNWHKQGIIEFLNGK